ncbi:penicillin-binding protein 2 [Candidatus Methylomirabilis sp.]|uniref:penicillin-binding protein 2 n=1 Tax=Candidatus Methylomirabilis sp. TaxID=2032687 RepID=UPI0030762A21
MSRERETSNLFAPFQKRIRVAAFLISAAILILLLRLWALQILEGERMLLLSLNNRLRLRPVEAPRGLILDRNGELMVENLASFDLYAMPEDMPDIEGTTRRLAEILRSSPDELRQRISQRQGSQFEPVLLRKGVDEQTVAAIEEQKIDLPGVNLRVRPVRAYPNGGSAASLLGYVTEVSHAQLKSKEFRDFRSGETMGQAGIERRYDAFIRGVDGGEQVEVDALGKVSRLIQQVEPRSGFNLHLTLDNRLQRIAEESFQGRNGALIAIHPSTGEILAMVSQPSYDPNQFSQRMTPEQWRLLASNPHHPMQNKGLQGQYAPGSIFKLITALAALEKGVITPETTFSCDGSFGLGSHIFHDWKNGGHGTLNLRQAIANSCNIYFYNAALKAGIEEITRVARELGLGVPSGFGLGDEAKGVIPSPQIHTKKAGGWYPGNTVMAGIGQGMVTVTPMQAVMMVSAIANGGTLYRPWVVRKVETMDRELIEEYGPELVRKVNIDPDNMAIVREGMQAVVSEGTGSRAKIPGLRVAGKTGTAQVVGNSGSQKGNQRDHAWFVAFAPADNPQIAIVLVVEHGGFGGQVAAPIAKSLLEAWFKLPKESGSVQVAEPEPTEGD